MYAYIIHTRLNRRWTTFNVQWTVHSTLFCSAHRFCSVHWSPGMMIKIKRHEGGSASQLTNQRMNGRSERVNHADRCRLLFSLAANHKERIIQYLSCIKPTILETMDSAMCLKSKSGVTRETEGERGD